jgi:hypothetical protein
MAVACPHCGASLAVEDEDEVAEESPEPWLAVSSRIALMLLIASVVITRLFSKASGGLETATAITLTATLPLSIFFAKLGYGRTERGRELYLLIACVAYALYAGYVVLSALL